MDHITLYTARYDQLYLVMSVACESSYNKIRFILKNYNEFDVLLDFNAAFSNNPWPNHVTSFVEHYDVINE